MAKLKLMLVIFFMSITIAHANNFITSIEAVKQTANNNSYFVIQGKLISRVGNNDYIFQDATGTIRVEMKGSAKHSRNMGALPINSTVTLKVTATKHYDYIELKAFELVANASTTLNPSTPNIPVEPSAVEPKELTTPVIATDPVPTPKAPTPPNSENFSSGANFNNSANYNTITNLAVIKEQAYDDDIFVVQGTILDRIDKRKYLFQDETGTILIDVKKDAFKYSNIWQFNYGDKVTLRIKVDRSYKKGKIELKVYDILAVNK